MDSNGRGSNASPRGSIPQRRARWDWQRLAAQMKAGSEELLGNAARLCFAVVYLVFGAIIFRFPGHELPRSDKGDIALTLLGAFAATWIAIGTVLSRRELARIQRIADDKELVGSPNHVEGLRRMREGQARMAAAMVSASNYCAGGTVLATCVALAAAGKIAAVSWWDAKHPEPKPACSCPLAAEPAGSASPGPKAIASKP